MSLARAAGQEEGRVGRSWGKRQGRSWVLWGWEGLVPSECVLGWGGEGTWLRGNWDEAEEMEGGKRGAG